MVSSTFCETVVRAMNSGSALIATGAMMYALLGGIGAAAATDQAAQSEADPPPPSDTGEAARGEVGETTPTNVGQTARPQVGEPADSVAGRPAPGDADDTTHGEPGEATQALEKAIDCYDGLDYDCTEARLAEALAGDLSDAALVQARYYQALVALAHRDEARARVAVRALLAAKSDFEPGPRAPPRLRALVDAARPVRLAWAARVDGTWTQLFSQDDAQWTEGVGLEVAGGLVVDERWVLELAGAYSDHRPEHFALRGLTVLSVTAGALRRRHTGPVRLGIGLAVGGSHVSVSGVTGADTYLGAMAQLPLEVAVPIWNRVGVAFRVAPSLLMVEDDDRAAFSFLLPFMTGVRYPL